MAIAETGSVTQAAQTCHVSQPAVTQAMGKLEGQVGGALFDRTRRGFFLTARGMALSARLRRAFGLLDPALAAVAPRLRMTATTAQLTALIGVREAENFTLAAERLGLAQPTVHRAIAQLEREVSRPLFERTAHGTVATRACAALAQATELAFAEMDQAEADIAELDGAGVGRIVIGALPLSRSVILPAALLAFQNERPGQTVTVIDGPYRDLLGGLRRGGIDVIVGALRDPAPIADVVQETLFDDRMAVIAGNHHFLAGKPGLTLRDLRGRGWLVPRSGTPARRQFDDLIGTRETPKSLLETGSILLMREMLCDSDLLGCISGAQAAAEVSKGLLTRLDIDLGWLGRPIGLTYRDNWVPTRAQARLLDLIRQATATP